jgi:hypothetical protein
MPIFITLLAAGVLLFALHRHRYVKFALKFLGASVSLEVGDHPVSTPAISQRDGTDAVPRSSSVTMADERLIETGIPSSSK